VALTRSRSARVEAGGQEGRRGCAGRQASSQGSSQTKQSSGVHRGSIAQHVQGDKRVHTHRRRRSLTDGQQHLLGAEGGEGDVAAAHQGDGIHGKHVHEVEHGGKVAPHVVAAEVHLWNGAAGGGVAHQPPPHSTSACMCVYGKRRCARRY
jgi:hypothetical protein